MVVSKPQPAPEILESPSAKVVPLFGRDEMNLVEFPFGPISPTTARTLEIDHVVRDRKTNREVSRRLIITGSDAFGLPRPIDEQVLVGLKALTQEAGFQSRKVWFSQYHLCQTLGWSPDGRAYKRLEASLDRIAGTTLKFKNAWWDKGEAAWRSHTFHLIDNVELCSAERYEQMRERNKSREQAACYFVWNEVIWKSFEDGYIKAIDMEMFRRIANGKRREVPLRLYRWLDKQFWRQDVVKIDVAKLALGTLGLQAKYPSEFQRIIERAAKVLIDCKFMADAQFQNGTTHNGIDAVFFKKKLGISQRQKSLKRIPQIDSDTDVVSIEPDSHSLWISQQSEEQLQEAESRALLQSFGSRLERQIIEDEKREGKPILQSGRIRQEYIRRFLEPDRYDFRSLPENRRQSKAG